MKIGAYQFPVTGDLHRNFRAMKDAVAQAASEGVRMLAFPECALTGYPPRDLPNSAAVDFSKVEDCLRELAKLAAGHEMYIIAGSITKEEGRFYNSAVILAPDGTRSVYRKRALWGWDRDNFFPGDPGGVLEIDGIKIGIRICFEVRFPEYFRELYQEATDLNLILFYDVSGFDDGGRYDLIRGHIRTRAVENVCHTLSVDTAGPWQTAPTGLYDRSGGVVLELERGREGLLVYDFLPGELDFGERGRKEYSDLLTGRSE